MIARPGKQVSALPASAERTALLRGKLALAQPARGYRVNVDTLLLAHFAAATRARAKRVVDLGAGVGALALAYGFFASASHADLVESDASLTPLALRNLRDSGQRGEVFTADLALDGLPGSLRAVADVVLSNPPFFAHRGSSRRDGARHGARHGALEPFLRAASDAMGRRAHAFFAYPAAALPEFLHAARGVGLVAKRLQLVHAFSGSPARLSLVELRRAKPGGLVVDPPVVEWTERGVRSELLARIVDGQPR